MWHPPATELAPAEFLSSVGRIFARFDPQDSGNISFGVAAAGARYFVKTAGDPAGPEPRAGAHGRRVARLENAERLARSVAHPALTEFVTSIESAWGRMLVYRWAEGENLYVPEPLRGDADSAARRFRSLPPAPRVAVVRSIIDLHVTLAGSGWVAGDFYDGCLIYDFDAGTLRVCDLDHYRSGPYRNTVGRMPGSTRFMAPEEFERGRVIDDRTTVFTLGRTAAIFLDDWSENDGHRARPHAPSPWSSVSRSDRPDPVRTVTAVACAPDPAARYPSVAALAEAFDAAVPA